MKGWLGRVLLLLILAGRCPQVLADNSGPGESGGSSDDSPDDDEAERDAEVEIRFLLPELRAVPGEVVEVPLEIETTAPLAMIAFSIEYDPRVLKFVEPRLAPEVETLFNSHPASESAFEWFRSQDEPGEEDAEPEDEDAEPEDEDAEPEDEEWLQVSIITAFEARPEFSIAAGTRQRIAHLRFRIAPDAPTGRHKMEFSSETDAPFQGRFADVEGKAVYNVVGIEGDSLTSGVFDSTAQAGIRSGASVVADLIGDIGVFQTGDVNLDASVDVSDPMATIGHLFLGQVPRVCTLTADTDGDGSIQLTDAIVILNHLFLSSRAWRPESVYLPRAAVTEQPSVVPTGCEW